MLRDISDNYAQRLFVSAHEICQFPVLTNDKIIIIILYVKLLDIKLFK